MEAWLIEELLRQEAEKPVQVPLFLDLPLPESTVIVEKVAEDVDRGVFEIQVL